jgi:nucleotide-binding universal stress UspA family protein
MNKFDSSKNGLLVAVDFSPYSQFALEFAAKQADCQDVNLSVLHVVHDPGEMPGYYAKLLKKKQLVNIEDMAEELLTEFIQKVREANPGIHSLETLSTILVVGLPVTRILEVVEKINPTQLFMGSQGRTGLKHLMLGSKAEQVLRLCPIPVTIVKNTTVAP